MTEHRNPFPTVDIIIELPDGIVLIQRKNPDDVRAFSNIASQILETIVRADTHHVEIVATKVGIE